MAKSDFHAMIGALDVEKKKRILAEQLPLLKLSKYVSDRLEPDAAKAIPDCVTCGVCCNFALFAQVKQSETARLDQFIEITLDGRNNEIPIDAALARNMETGSCVYLIGTLGERVGCGIYDTRPSVCRDFDPGSPRCHEYRRMYGLEPQLTKAEMKAAMAQLECGEVSKTIDEIAIVEDGRVQTFERTDDGFTSSEKIRLRMVAFIENDGPHDIHTYYDADETWYECELIGMTVDEAREFVVKDKI
jgi:Fe-S-cluster containining protein